MCAGVCSASAPRPLRTPGPDRKEVPGPSPGLRAGGAQRGAPGAAGAGLPRAFGSRWFVRGDEAKRNNTWRPPRLSTFEPGSVDTGDHSERVPYSWGGGGVV